MRIKPPRGNGIVLAVLRSPMHRLLSGAAIELRYTGRLSGREYVLPVQYARAGDRLVVRVQGADRKSWWRNFRSPWPVRVRLSGSIHQGTARVVEPDDPDWLEASARYAARWGRRERTLSGPLVVITLD